MIYAMKIKMRNGCRTSQKLAEIDSIYLYGVNEPGFYTKESIYDYLKKNPGTIKVNISPYPNVVPALSPYNEKYVKSDPNSFGYDNLLCLPRE